MRKNGCELICSSSFFAIFPVPVLHKEFAGAKSDKLLHRCINE